MNILILGTGKVEQKIINLCLKSKLLDHLYTASSEPLEDIPNVEYSDYNDLSKKAKLLQTDIILLADKKYIEDGCVEIFKKKLLNIISVNKKWFNLESSRLVAKQLMNHYSINNPNVILAPLSFPVVIKTNKPNATKIAHSMQELVEIRENLIGETFLEEYFKGDVICLLSLWDGKNLVHFDSTYTFTEVQQDRLDLYKTKLNFMLSDENADFIGFFSSKLIWSKNDWYVLEYNMHLDNLCNLISIEHDFLYLLNSAIYQKLNEI